MARVVLVDGFVGAAVEGEVVFVGGEAGGAAEDAGGAGELVDAGGDG